MAAWAVHSSQVAAQTDPQSAHGRDAMTTARTYVASVMTYDVGDYADLDRRIREISTTDFAEVHRILGAGAQGQYGRGRIVEGNGTDRRIHLVDEGPGAGPGRLGPDDHRAGDRRRTA